MILVTSFSLAPLDWRGESLRVEFEMLGTKARRLMQRGGKKTLAKLWILFLQQNCTFSKCLGTCGKSSRTCIYLHGFVQSFGKVQLFVFKALNCKTEKSYATSCFFTDGLRILKCGQTGKYLLYHRTTLVHRIYICNLTDLPSTRKDLCRSPLTSLTMLSCMSYGL